MVYVSIATVIIFALLHWWIPFHNKDLTDKPENLKNLVIGSVIGVLFLGYELFTFGELYFPGVMLGGAFVILAIFYFFLGVRIMQKFGENPILADAKTDERPYKNTVLGYL
ncbi:MAG: hypothetical protein H6767_09145 [Candidatus Peribacteria bacterium]|nr:MAG: hypothetical protein H6767_09145 [Candidatus Peribacteria bacterium]